MPNPIPLGILLDVNDYQIIKEDKFFKIIYHLLYYKSILSCKTKLSW